MSKNANEFNQSSSFTFVDMWGVALLVLVSRMNLWPRNQQQIAMMLTLASNTENSAESKHVQHLDKLRCQSHRRLSPR